MSTLCPYRIIKGDDGLSVNVEWDVHYLTDEQIGMVRKYVAETESENAKLRELAERAWKTAERLCQAFDGPCSSDGVTAYKPCPMGERYEECVYGQLQRELHELGVDV